MVLAIIVIIINTLIAMVYYFIIEHEKKEEPVNYRSKTIVMLLCPVIGPVYIGLSYLFFKYVFNKEVNLDDVIFKKDRVKTFMYADEERGRTMVSMEEALAVTDKSNLRNLMLNVVRGNIEDSLNSISMALDSEDSETSHYAASVLQDSLNDFRVTVQKGMRHIEEDEENRIEYILIMIPYMNHVLEQQVFTDLEQRSFVSQFDEICSTLYEDDVEKLTIKHIEAVCMRLLEIKEFERCEMWCERAVGLYPGALAAYTCRLKLYFTKGDREAFLKVLDELKKSNIVIDNETLEMIRVFL